MVDAPHVARKIPLPLRLPNAPPVFVGREREMGRLAELISRAPVTVVCGPDGIGKTATTIRALRAHFPDRVPLVFYVRLGENTSRRSPALELATAITRGLAQHEPPADLDRAQLIGLVIDLADEADVWLVLDDADRAEAQAVAECLEMVAAYAERAKIIACMREPLVDAQLREQHLALAPLSEEVATALVRDLRFEATPEIIAAAVAAGAGNPWQLRKLATATTPDEADPVELSPTMKATLVTLALLGDAVPAAALGGLARDDDVAVLQQRGLVEVDGDGIRVGSLSKKVALADLSDADRRHAMELCLEHLNAQSGGMVGLERLRLLLALGRHDEAVALLTEYRSTLEHPTLAGKTWQVLAGSAHHSVFGSILLRLAAITGEPDAVKAARPPPADGSIADRMNWARVLATRNHFDECVNACAALLALSEVRANAELEFDLRCLSARALGNLSRFEAAYEAMALATAHGDEQTVVQQGMLAGAAAELLDGRALAEHLERLQAALPRVDRTSFLQGIRHETYALACAGRNGAVVERLEPIMKNLPLDAAGWVTQERLSVLYMISLRQIGRFEEADRIFQREQHKGRARRGQIAQMQMRLERGDLHGLEEELASIGALRRRRGTTGANAAITAVTTRLATVLGVHAAVEDPQATVSPADRARLLWRGRIAALRHGRDNAKGADVDPSTNAAVACLSWIAEATAALLTDPLAALRAIDEGRSIAASQPDLLADTELLGLAAEAYLLSRRWANLARAAQALADVGDRLDSRLYRDEASYYAMVAGRGQRPEVLECLAGREGPAATATRRARHWLGASSSLDLVDVATNAVLLDLGWRRAATPTAPCQGPWQAGWGLDLAAKCVWLEGGRRVDLRRRSTQWRFLVVLVEAGGSLDKASLIERVWQDANYDPRLHDNKMWITVHKIRQLLETDAEQPTHLETTLDGYGLGGTWRVLGREGV